MKRALLIAGGTVGGLGAVLAITPPQLGSSSSGLGGGLDLAANTTAGAQTTTTAAPAATTSSKPSAGSNSSTAKATTTKKATAQPSTSQSAAATQSPTASASATATPTKAASNKATTGTFVGDPYSMRYGTVQVQITISGGKITDAQAIQAPGGGNQRYTDRAVPVMRQNTLAAQSSNITGASGASYTSYAWYISLQSALKKAGWM
jgi:uncharacterized protein with FMN-binding domain